MSMIEFREGMKRVLDGGFGCKDGGKLTSPEGTSMWHWYHPHSANRYEAGNQDSLKQKLETMNGLPVIAIDGLFASNIPTQFDTKTNPAGIEDYKLMSPMFDSVAKKGGVVVFADFATNKFLLDVDAALEASRKADVVDELVTRYRLTGYGLGLVGVVVGLVTLLHESNKGNKYRGIEKRTKKKSSTTRKFGRRHVAKAIGGVLALGSTGLAINALNRSTQIVNYTGERDMAIQKYLDPLEDCKKVDIDGLDPSLLQEVADRNTIVAYKLDSLDMGKLSATIGADGKKVEKAMFFGSSHLTTEVLNKSNEDMSPLVAVNRTMTREANFLRAQESWTREQKVRSLAALWVCVVSMTMWRQTSTIGGGDAEKTYIPVVLGDDPKISTVRFWVNETLAGQKIESFDEMLKVANEKAEGYLK